MSTRFSIPSGADASDDEAFEVLTLTANLTANRSDDNRSTQTATYDPAR
jgi:hypothetical protein